MTRVTQAAVVNWNELEMGFMEYRLQQYFLGEPGGRRRQHTFLDSQEDGAKVVVKVDDVNVRVRNFHRNA